MIGRILIAAISIFFSVCAFSGPEAPAPAATTSSASADTVAPDNPPAPPAVDDKDLDAAEVVQTVDAAPENDPDELICRREQETGSKFFRKICRTRAEIERRREQDQQIMQTGRKTSGGSDCALNKNCG